VRSDRERLLDIAEAIDRIIKYTRRGRKEFEDKGLIQTWVIHHIEIVGEAARRISLTFEKRILKFRGLRSWRCETCSHTTTSASTSNVCGTRSNLISPTCVARYRFSLMNCPIRERPLRL
jgi:uncharacterized protein with HEPN domain